MVRIAVGKFHFLPKIRDRYVLTVLTLKESSSAISPTPSPAASFPKILETP